MPSGTVRLPSLMLHRHGFLALLVLLVLWSLAGCASLPSEVKRTPSTAYTDTDGTRLGQLFADQVKAHPGLTGVFAVPNGTDAFAARMLLARAAQRSLDLQYYIWRSDNTGDMLFQAVWEAAERGVRVRILLDDVNTKDLDDTIATLDSHPNIEVRLFNPFANRNWRIGDFTTDFSRVNRRMHNKSFTADNQMTVVGGRNVGNEYFGVDSPVEFADLDAVLTGAAVHDVSKQFDLFWNSESAYPALSVVRSVSKDTVAKVRQGWDQTAQQPQTADYIHALSETPLVQVLNKGTVPLEWVSAHVVHDNPAKALDEPGVEKTYMLPHLIQALGKPLRELDLVSPYFVPTRDGTRTLRTLADQGIKVRVLTNSLAATDVSPVYAGYTRYREDLLRGGNLSLYELKPYRPMDRASRKEHKQASGTGSSSASLHAKTFAVDRNRIYIGSFNLDPRSQKLNTEMGVVLDSPALATRLAKAFDGAIPQKAYEVRLTTDGDDIEWVERTDKGEVIHSSTPEVGVFRRIWSSFLSILPIEWLL